LTHIVKDIMTKQVMTVRSEDTIEEASKIMAEKRRGYAVILRARRPVGMVTERLEV